MTSVLRLLGNLLRYIANARPAQNSAIAASPAPTISRQWPIGSNYLTLLPQGTKNYRSWTYFRLLAAMWYLAALEEIFAETDDLDRFVGVEMALDGFFGSCSSAFDTSVGGLLVAIEEFRHVPAASQTPTYQRSWRKVKDAAAKPLSITLACEAAVDSALDGEMDPQPTGWLARLRRVRNRMTHEDTLIRAFHRNVSDNLATGTSSAGSQPTQINVPGLGQIDPLPYMRDALQSTAELVDDVLRDAERIDPRP